ncbi:MAG: peptide ABC transporter substrate-binding protein [Tissierellia bacterium]|nr:peptide ABC transporter substrate-binding protein [Tissierellia bacterium]
MRGRKKLAILFILLISIFVSGCQENKQSFNEGHEGNSSNIDEYKPEYGGEIVLPVTNINSLNPLIVNNRSYYYFSKLIFESLFEYDENFQIVNQLVENYSFKDNNTLNIKLKDNVYWHDGEKLTAYDVAFTINTIKYSDDDSTYKRLWRSYVGNFNGDNINNIMKALVIDELTMDIVFGFEFSHKLEVLTFPIIPRHIFVDSIENGRSYERALVAEDYIPIGTGPFKFVSYEKYKNIQLEANENYREGRPYIDTIIGMILDDKELALISFETGQTDLAFSVGVDWEKFAQNKQVNIIEYISQSYEFLGFNFSNEVFSKYGQGLRRAIAYGINRQEIIENVYLGHATQIDVPIHPNSWLLSDEANIYGYNTDMARKELENMGWNDIDGDGYYEDEEGNEVVLSLTTNSFNNLRLKVAEIIVDNLKDIGIQVIKDYESKLPDNLSEEVTENQWIELNEKLKEGKFDIVLLGWNLSPVPELSFAFHSSQIKSNTNFIRYSNEKMDKALLDAYTALNLENKFKAYKNVQEIFLEELPYVSLFFKNEALLLNSKIKGDIDPTFYDLYRNIEKWYIPKDLQEEKVDNN